MTRIEMAPEVFDDFDRFFDYIAEIVAAVQILATSPLIGRPVKGGKRELIIGRASRGYVALYRYVAPIDTVFVLAMRSQRESGYKNNSSPDVLAAFRATGPGWHARMNDALGEWLAARSQA